MSEKSIPRPRKEAVADAVLEIAASRGLDGVTVREVAATADVSIGTVQHYFPTKNQMLAGAYTEASRRIRQRLQALPLGPDSRRNMMLVASQLLPLDQERSTEARVYIAFAAAAATSAGLSEIQQNLLEELHTALTTAFTQVWGGAATPARCKLAAHTVIALVDGLALHSVTTKNWIADRQLTDAVALVLDSLRIADPN
ncbi:TetR family transcriptional regulator C-terminal domain-containing protein [Gordonia sp. HY442]|uniref:TetR/AcrR family transcriptional regulator n=1 Tax=Gordonia zhenghanii TaxID=2911516 RepID=UPI001F397495|nr:TetR/AcrR family transcriptional regulator [Gordonia zhenghanii]MCF8603463.1 TetR family transcriptional regulator C-terminal domain-containing protein [Gordonia zhenghanii]